MRSSTAAWAAALAVMSMCGPFTKAEAAPAQEQSERERPKYYFPRHIKRQFFNSSTFAAEMSSLLGDVSSTTSSSALPPISEPPLSLPSTPLDTEALLRSLLSNHLLPETSNTVVTTTWVGANGPLPGTETYTLTYTETSSPVSASTVESTTAPLIQLPPETQPPSSTGQIFEPSLILPSTTSFPSLELPPIPVSSDLPPSPHRSHSHHKVNGTSSSSSSGENASTPGHETHSSSRPSHGFPPLSGIFPFGGTPHLTGHPDSTSGTTTQVETVEVSPLPESIPLFGSTGALPSITLLPTISSTASSTNVASTGGLPSSIVLPTLGSHLGSILVGVSTIIDSTVPVSPAPSSLATASPSVSGSHQPHHTSGLIPGLSLSVPFLPSGASILPTEPLPFSHESNTGNNTATTETRFVNTTILTTSTGSSGILVIPLTTESIPFTTELLPLPSLTVPASLPTALGGSSIALSAVVSSVASEASSVVASAQSSVLSEASSIASETSNVPPSLTAEASAALSSLASSLSSELASIAATATDSRVSASLASDFSSVLSSAASSLESELSTGLPIGSALTAVSSGIASVRYSTITGSSGLTVIPIPLTSSLLTGSLGTTAIPVHISTPAVGVSMLSSATSSGFVVSTSVALTGGTTTTLEPSTQSSHSRISESSESSTATAVVTSPTSHATSETSLSSASTPPTSTESSAVSSGSSSASISLRPTTTSPSSIPVTVAESSARTRSSSSSVAPHSIIPVGSNTATTLFVPTSLIYAPSTTPASSNPSGSDIVTAASETSSSSSGLPTYMPRLIQPPGGMPATPANMTLIQLGFNYGLNYPFIVNQENATNQIFAYLPQGIAYGLSIPQKQVVMEALMPYDTTNSLGYITTLAQAYIPSDMVTSMQQCIHAPNGPMYTNPDPFIQTLMSMVNPTIPLFPGAALDDGTPATSTWNPAATTSASAGDGAPIGGDSSSSQPVKGTSVGIGVGAVAGAAVYAAAMVYVARRYRRNRRRHQRASSLPAAEAMSQVSGGGMGGYFMSGANGRGSAAFGSAARGSRHSDGSSNGRSVRGQAISNPIMAENSLGWN